MSATRPSLIAALSVGLALGGCAGLDRVGVAQSTAAPAGSITVAGCRPYKPLLPSNTAETCGATVLDAVAAKLATYDRSTGRAVNVLAAAISTQDAKKFTITLRSDARYSDGSPVRAADFVNAWNYAAYGPHRQLNQFLFAPIAGFGKVAGAKPSAKTMSGLKVRDARRFTVNLSRPNSTFVQRLGATAFAALPPSFFADKGAAYRSRPLGAGPYAIVGGNAATGYVLDANPNYVGPTPPSVGRITFKNYDDFSQAYADVVANQLDVLGDIPGDVVRAGAYTSDLGTRTFSRSRAVVSTLVFPSPRADTSYGNAKLRKALSLAIDRGAVIRKVAGAGAVAATGWGPPGLDGVDGKGCGSACTYNPTQARTLFKAAGGHAGPITIAYNADADNRPWVVAACKSIASTLRTTCRPTAVRDFATFRTNISARKQKGVFRSGWQGDYSSLENFLTSLYATGGQANDGDFSNAKFDSILKQAAATPDLATANALYRKAERTLRGTMPAIPLWSPVSVGGHSTKVSAAAFTVFGTLDLTSIELA
jgi:oligopeptide transport system substrate-binding protein